MGAGCFAGREGMAGARAEEGSSHWVSMCGGRGSPGLSVVPKKTTLVCPGWTPTLWQCCSLPPLGISNQNRRLPNAGKPPRCPRTPSRQLQQKPAFIPSMPGLFLSRKRERVRNPAPQRQLKSGLELIDWGQCRQNAAACWQPQPVPGRTSWCCGAQR